MRNHLQKDERVQILLAGDCVCPYQPLVTLFWQTSFPLGGRLETGATAGSARYMTPKPVIVCQCAHAFRGGHPAGSGNFNSEDGPCSAGLIRSCWIKIIQINGKHDRLIKLCTVSSKIARNVVNLLFLIWYRRKRDIFSLCGLKETLVLFYCAFVSVVCSINGYPCLGSTLW